MTERLQETMRRNSEQDLGMWEVSVLDAREDDGTEVSRSGRGAAFGNVESGASLKHQMAL